MAEPLASIIIPTFNHGRFLGTAIKSVLNQTWQNFEILVVNDSSQDHTQEVVAQFDDPRLRYLEHENNLGLPATRNTGIQSSFGEYIFLLDADDYFSPSKLETHITFLQRYPDVGATYNPRFDLHHDSDSIREIWSPPPTVDLADLLVGFPFSPSDMVVRREWAFSIGLFDESYIHFSEDLDFNCRLALAGCKFASVGRVLNYRRYHSSRFVNNIPERLNAALRAIDQTINDPRCPEHVKEYKSTAYLNNYLVWTFLALLQKENYLALDYLHNILALSPEIIDGHPSDLMRAFLNHTIADENMEHDKELRAILSQIPDDLARLNDQYEWAVARGYLYKGIRALIWDRSKIGESYLSKIANKRIVIEDDFVEAITYQLINFEKEFGEKSTQKVIENISTKLVQISENKLMRRLKGCFYVNQAFRKYHAGYNRTIPATLLKAFVNNPQYLFNRGVMSAFLRSQVRTSHGGGMD